MNPRGSVETTGEREFPRRGGSMTSEGREAPGVHAASSRGIVSLRDLQRDGTLAAALGIPLTTASEEEAWHLPGAGRRVRSTRREGDALVGAPVEIATPEPTSRAVPESKVDTRGADELLDDLDELGNLLSGRSA